MSTENDYGVSQVFIDNLKTQFNSLSSTISSSYNLNARPSMDQSIKVNNWF